MAPLLESGLQAPRIIAWRCSGCGRLEAPQPCIGVCSDRKIELVDAGDHERVLAQVEKLQVEYDRLAQFIRMVASNKPHEGCWEKSYRHLQVLSKEMLDSCAR